MKNIVLTIICLLAFLVTSCYNDSDFRKEIDLPTQPPKVVVYGFISPDQDTIRINIYQSKPINASSGNSGAIIKNARVILSSNGKTAVVPWYNETYLTRTLYDSIIQQSFTYNYGYKEGEYKIATKDFPLLPGARVDLSVSTDIGQISSYCIVPEINTLSADIETTWTEATNGNKFYINVLLNGFGSGQEYYHTTNRIASYSQYYTMYPEAESGNEIFLHKPTDNKDVKLKYGCNYYYTETNESPNRDTLTLILAKTDEFYYKYHTSYNSYLDTDENPFVEPIMLYSNIKGGLGVFSAYRMSKIKFPMRDLLK